MNKQILKWVMPVVMLLGAVIHLEAQTQKAKKSSTVAKPAAAPGRPNILIIWGDDVGMWHTTGA